ncbi:hypothetical protein RSAG8_07795, partial [Rhizoctonia solani AG-8 WAC10335]
RVPGFYISTPLSLLYSKIPVYPFWVTLRFLVELYTPTYMHVCITCFRFLYLGLLGINAIYASVDPAQDRTPGSTQPPPESFHILIPLYAPTDLGGEKPSQTSTEYLSNPRGTHWWRAPPLGSLFFVHHTRIPRTPDQRAQQKRSVARIWPEYIHAHDPRSLFVLPASSQI